MAENTEALMTFWSTGTDQSESERLTEAHFMLRFWADLAATQWRLCPAVVSLRVSEVVEGKLAWKRRLQAITMFTCDSRNAVGCGFEWGTGSCVHGVQLEVKKPA